MTRLGGLWVVVIAVWLWVVSVIAAASDGTTDHIEACGLTATGGGLVLFWGLRTLFGPRLRGRSLVIWVSIPTMIPVALGIAFTDTPLVARLWAGESWLREYARGSDPAPPNYTDARWIGCFRVEKVFRHDGVVMFVTGSNVFDQAGVAYAPDGIPANPSPDADELNWARFKHLYGPWFRFDIPD